MKTMKRIFAIAVAVLLVAMMIPTAFAGTADDPNTVEWTCNKPGYTFTVYQVAGYSEDTGAYPLADNVSGITADDVKKAVTENEMAALANKCVNATLPTEGTVFTTNEGEGSFKLANGIYYIKCTGKAGNFKSMLKESIVVFPNKYGDNESNATTLNVILSDKINEGQPTAKKEFKIGDTLTTNPQTFGTSDHTFTATTTDSRTDRKTITYVLTADIPGTATNKLTSYVITDKMGSGLKAVTEDNIDSVVVKPASGASRTLTKNTEWTFTTTSTDINRVKADTIDGKYETKENTFGIKLVKETVLDDTTKTFYGEGNQVVVTFHTEIDYATVTDENNPLLGQSIVNHDDMIYGNKSGYNVVPGNDVELKTYKPYAKKLDANTGAVLTGKSATFGLYEDAACEKLIKSASTNTSTGIADFEITLPAGTYYIKETAAPAGYNLNTVVQEVTLGGTTGTTTVEISDTPAKLPSTGGNGTMVFTIVGGSLVLLAAALFIIVMKKRSSAK